MPTHAQTLLLPPPLPPFRVGKHMSIISSPRIGRSGHDKNDKNDNKRISSAVEALWLPAIVVGTGHKNIPDPRFIKIRYVGMPPQYDK